MSVPIIKYFSFPPGRGGFRTPDDIPPVPAQGVYSSALLLEESVFIIDRPLRYATYVFACCKWWSDTHIFSYIVFQRYVMAIQTGCHFCSFTL